MYYTRADRQNETRHACREARLAADTRRVSVATRDILHYADVFRLSRRVWHLVDVLGDDSVPI